MALLNYTSNVDADKTAQEISRCLSSHGARSVLTEYDDAEGVIKSLSFQIALNGKEIAFRLPCDWKPVYEILKVQFPIREPSKSGSEGDMERSRKTYERRHSDMRIQAVKTAWRIVKDWVEAQMALVETNMVTTQQVFLPYMVIKGGMTLSEKITQSPEFLLGDGK